MRIIKRWWRRRKALKLAQPLLHLCQPEVEQVLQSTLTWQIGGGAGQDVVYYALRDNTPVAVLRITLPAAAAARAALPTNLPFIPLDSRSKIEREWSAYTTGFVASLTPQPLWHNDFAILCSYINGTSLYQMFSQGHSPLTLITDALPHIAALHQSGTTHMDMSPANILIEKETGRTLFIDFEYGAAPGLTLEQQQLYDYLRLLESTWKMLTPEERDATAPLWGDELHRIAPPAVLQASLTPLLPGIHRIHTAPQLTTLFTTLTQ